MSDAELVVPEQATRRRRAAISSEPVSNEAVASWKPPKYDKPAETHSFLREIVDKKLALLFGHLDDYSKEAVIDAMQRKEAKMGDDVIRQGDMGDYFYILDVGKVEIFVDRPGKGKEKVLECSRGSSFGELALLYNSPRAATCTAVEDCKLWALDRESFKMMLVTAENIKKKRYEGFLEEVEIFKPLNRYERSQLSDLLTAEKYADGDAIIRQGETGNRFYILEQGRARCTIKEGDGPELVVCNYQKGDYFGELALMCEGPRKATVYAEGITHCLWIDKDTFDRVLGPVVDILSKNADKYPTYKEILSKLET